MKLLSICVGGPREVEYRGKRVQTCIWKAPVAGPVRVGKMNLEGDQQSDPSVHGGASMAVYAYPVEHYALWKKELPEAELGFGAFGENLTVTGLLEESVRAGDRLKIGTAELVVTKPRFPCFKLGIKFGTPGIIKKMMQTGRTGWYMSVAREGVIQAGDAIEVLGSDTLAPTIEELVDVKRGAA